MAQLIDAYSKIKSMLGNETEPLASVQLVESYRRYWKPENVKLILLAESHVFTSDGDRKITFQIPNLPNYPNHYARFVYCLRYGEKKLTKDHIYPMRDVGTPQFWKLFYSCNNRISSINDFRPILARTSYKKRIHNKIRLLNDLKTKGVWLVDASIVGLLRDGKKLNEIYSTIETSWQFYTRDVIKVVKPEYVICVGRGVARIVENDLKRFMGMNYTVIPQPNAYLSSDELMELYRSVSEICRQYAIS
jgi:hypothetical protein